MKAMASIGWLLAGASIACASGSPAAKGEATNAPPSVVDDTSQGAAAANPRTAPEPAGSPDVAAGVKAFDAGSYGDARKSFEAATQKNPRDYQAFYDVAMACEKLGDKVAAEGAYKAALAIKPDFDVAAVALGTLELDEGRTDDALAVTQAAIAARPGSPTLHENLGTALAMRGDQDRALPELEQAAKLAPTEPLFQLTLAHWLNAWHVRGASFHLDRALGMARDDLGMLASIGFEYRMAGDFASCIKTFDKAVQIKDGGEVRTERGICKLGVKDDAGAIGDLQAAVSVEPSYPAGHYWLAGRLAILRRYEEAAAEYAKYLQLQPHGALAKTASERMKAAQDLAARERSSKKNTPVK
jgi:tetratricopeptide (TPR) repeat protein